MDDIYKKQIEAYVDNELDENQCARIEETMENFPELKEYADKISDQNNLLKDWWATSKDKHN